MRSLLTKDCLSVHRQGFLLISYLIFIQNITIAQHSVLYTLRDAKSIASGRTGAVIYNPHNGLNNPAHSVLTKSNGLYFLASNYYGVSGLYQGNLAYDFKLQSRNGFNFSLNYDGSPELNESLANFAWSRLIKKDAALGISVSGMMRSLPEAENQYGIIVSGGFQFRLIDHVLLGGMVRNPLPVESKSNLYTLPALYSFGVNYCPLEFVNFNAELQKQSDYPISIHFGVEYFPHQKIGVWLGYQSRTNSVSIGTKYKMTQKISAEFFGEYQNVLGFHFGLGVNCRLHVPNSL